MDLSQKHTDARLAAARVPANEASLALLVQDTQPSRVSLYAAPRPAPGDPPASAALCTIDLLAAAGVMLLESGDISLYVPIEGVNAGAGLPTWARITDGAGDWYADASVSDTSGSGEIKVQALPLAAGATTRVVSATLT